VNRRVSQPEIIEFDADRPIALVQRVEQLIEDRNGWVNFQAIIENQLIDGPPARAGVFGWFSSKGPTAPICTWVPGELIRKGGIAPDQIGIQHPGGPRAVLTLRENGLALPEHWKRVSDHPKRGLVLSSTATTSPTDAKPAIEWIIAASRILAGHQLPTVWGAMVHLR